MTAVPIDHSPRRRIEPEQRRTKQRVRRNSRLKQRDWHAHFSWSQGRRLLIALKILARTLRKKGQRTGAAGTISRGAMDLAELLVGLAVRFKGRLEPPVEYLARELNTAEKTIHAWKEQLRIHGFLQWQRRYVETGRDGIRGPQVAQTTNAYYLHLPKLAEDALNAKLGPRIAAGDKADAFRRRNPALADTLDRLGTAVQEDAAGRSGRLPQRESPETSESRPT